MSLNEGLDPDLGKKLAALRYTPPRSVEKAALSRTAFLEQAQSLTGAVSISGERRPNGWMHALQSIFAVPRKEHSPMFSPLVTILIVISFVLGGGSLTVVGAQSSQPDQLLYTVKLLSEDARLQLAPGAQTALQLQLEFTDRRAAEIQMMFQNGKTPSEVIQNRYQNQIEKALRLAVGMADPQAIQALEQVRLHLQNEQQAFLQLNPNANPQSENALTRLKQMVQLHLQWLEEGLADPAGLRQQLGQQMEHKPAHQPDGNGGQGNPSQMGMTAMPGNPGVGGGHPWTNGTPTPGSGYGPGIGTGSCTACTPNAGNAGGMMGNPWTTGTPTPGSGYGPGPGPMPTQSTGAGTGGGMGPMPTSGMGGGGGMRP